MVELKAFKKIVFHNSLTLVFFCLLTVSFEKHRVTILCGCSGEWTKMWLFFPWGKTPKKLYFFPPVYVLFLSVNL